MDIHHYTRASTLPLILQSQKIRFTRADQLDDGSEMPFKTAHVDARNYFVSSWTTVSTEHSGQWFRYGDQHRGIRITLPDKPFDFHYVNWEISRDCVSPSLQGSKVGVTLRGVTMPFTTTEMLGKGYILSPYSHNMSNDFGGAVEYVASPESRVRELLMHDGRETVIYDAGKLGRIKSNVWTDQAEYRFVLMAQEGIDLDCSLSQDSYVKELLNLYENNLIAGIAMGSPQVKYIDLPLANEASKKMVITLGSHITDKDREQIEQAVAQYSPEIRLEESRMNVRRNI